MKYLGKYLGPALLFLFLVGLEAAGMWLLILAPSIITALAFVITTVSVFVSTYMLADMRPWRG